MEKTHSCIDHTNLPSLIVYYGDVNAVVSLMDKIILGPMGSLCLCLSVSVCLALYHTVAVKSGTTFPHDSVSLSVSHEHQV